MNSTIRKNGENFLERSIEEIAFEMEISTLNEFNLENQKQSCAYDANGDSGYIQMVTDSGKNAINGKDGNNFTRNEYYYYRNEYEKDNSMTESASFRSLSGFDGLVSKKNSFEKLLADHGHLFHDHLHVSSIEYSEDIVASIDKEIEQAADDLRKDVTTIDKFIQELRMAEAKEWLKLYEETCLNDEKCNDVATNKTVKFDEIVE